MKKSLFDKKIFGLVIEYGKKICSFIKKAKILLKFYSYIYSCIILLKKHNLIVPYSIIFCKII